MLVVQDDTDGTSRCILNRAVTSLAVVENPRPGKAPRARCRADARASELGPSRHRGCGASSRLAPAPVSQALRVSIVGKSCCPRRQCGRGDAGVICCRHSRCCMPLAAQLLTAPHMTLRKIGLSARGGQSIQ